MLDSEHGHVQKRHPVLYVDDEPSNRLIFRSQFGGDFKVLLASCAEEAMATLGQQRVSVLVTDQRMPGASGIELCEQVRLQYPGVRRMLITAYSDQKTAIDAINRGGVQAYIVKPWRPEEVAAELRSAIFSVELETTSRELMLALTERERLLAIDAIRRGILHDISSPAGTASLACDELGVFLDSLHGRIDRDELRGAMDLLSVLEHALGHLGELQRSFREGPRTFEHRPRKLRLNELLKTVSALVGIDPDVPCEITCPDDLVVRADQLGLVRTVINLVTNARQAIAGAGKTSGTVRITAGVRGPMAELQVCDDGPGVPESDRERIFEAAYTTRESSGGKGIGLAVSRELAERDGGQLRCVPSPSGIGSCFVLSVPRVASEDEPALPGWGGAEVDGLQRPTDGGSETMGACEQGDDAAAGHDTLSRPPR